MPTTPDRKTSQPYIVNLDDDPHATDLVMRLLAAEGYEVEVFNYPPKAIESIKKRRPDVLIIDYRMPVMFGDKVLQILDQDEETKDIPAVVVSATDDLSKQIIRGRTRFIKKPYDIDNLVAVVVQSLTVDAGSASIKRD